MNENVKFCTKCGKRQLSTTSPTTTPPTPTNNEDKVTPSRASRLLEQKTKTPSSTTVEKIVPSSSKTRSLPRESTKESTKSEKTDITPIKKTEIKKTIESSPKVTESTSRVTESSPKVTESSPKVTESTSSGDTTVKKTVIRRVVKKDPSKTTSTSTTTIPSTTTPTTTPTTTTTTTPTTTTSTTSERTRETIEPPIKTTPKTTTSLTRNSISSKDTAQILKQLREYKNKWQVSELRVKETQEKLTKLVQAVKEDRATRLKDYQTMTKEKKELEERANEAEVTLLSIVQKIKENEKRQKLKFEQTINQNTTQLNLAMNRAKQTEEKLGRLLETMQNVVKQKGGTGGELVGKLAELEQQQNKDLETIDKLKLDNEKLKGLIKEESQKHERAKKLSNETVEELQGNLTKALEELDSLKNKMERQKYKKDDKEYEDEKSQEIIKKLTLKYNKALERLAESEKKNDEQEKTIRSYEDKTSKMVQMVQRNRQEMQNKIDQLTSKLRESSSFTPTFNQDVQDKLADALERAEFAETKRQELQEKVNQLEEKLWATEKNLWDTEDKTDEQIRELEGKLLLAQEKLKKLANSKGTTTTAITGEVELTQKQEQMLVKVLKETKVKIQDLETKLKQRTELSEEQSIKQQKRIEQLEKLISEGGSLGMGGGGTPGGNLSALTPEQANKIKKTLQALQERAKKAEVRNKELENEIQQLKAGGIG